MFREREALWSVSGPRVPVTGARAATVSGVPNSPRAPRTRDRSATGLRRGAPAVRIAATAAAAAFLLTGCDIAQDVADEFGNARQVSEEPQAAGPGDDAVAGQGASGSPTPSPDPLPSFADSTVVGDYAPGFPPDLLPMPKGAQLLATSARPVEGSEPATVQVTLNLSAKQKPGKLMEQIAGTLAKRGFESVEAPEKNGMDKQLAFTRTTTVKENKVNESLLVGILRDDDRSLLTLSGTVAAPVEEPSEKKETE